MGFYKQYQNGEVQNYSKTEIPKNEYFRKNSDLAE